ncbi:hypothetical protein COV24_02150 [candidate division WWE3 bacterium CG10_big_fil_rev_8_21_14_0_10_32_10]|uniref:Glycosyltransferase RgtA/B/C/D-like domain-containing protein n=1 Tax=candidate division WWE3 bacterium CG10_big_fil_rev_8_21_14_0_10_32_10 TaxID=1975090 RepID=A0A2H0RC39_UNCKA|nr:MAG: hypothetical protein COV24_02150 [candidate division WWE3 bacterium CG10_big_fil_rev_8_21_14_0_10_32_10]
MKLLKENIFPIIIIVIGIFYVYHLSLESCLHKEWCGQDIDQYKDYSDSILSGHGFAASNVANIYFVTPDPGNLYIPEILRLPSFSYFITILRLIYDNPLVLVYLNLFLYLGILIYTYLFARMYLGKFYSSLVLLLVAFYPTLLFYSGIYANVDIFSCFMFMGYIFHVLKFENFSFSYKHVFMALLYGTLAILSRQNALPIILIPALYICLNSIFRRKIGYKFKRALLVLSIMILVLFGWSYRNYTIVNSLGLSFYSGNQLYSEHIIFTRFPNQASIYLYNWAKSDKGITFYIQNRIKNGDTIAKAYVSYNSFMKNIMFEHIFKYPIKTLNEYVFSYKTFFMVYPFSSGDNAFLFNLMRIYNFINYFILILLPIFPILIYAKKDLLSEKYEGLIFLWFSTNLYCFASTFFHGTTIGNRGVLPIFPIIVFICIYFLSVIISRTLNLDSFDVYKHGKKTEYL